MAAVVGGEWSSPSRWLASSGCCDCWVCNCCWLFLLLLNIWYMIDRSPPLLSCCWSWCGWPLLVEPVDEAEKTPSESSEHFWPPDASSELGPVAPLLLFSVVVVAVVVALGAVDGEADAAAAVAAAAAAAAPANHSCLWASSGVIRLLGSHLGR